MPAKIKLDTLTGLQIFGYSIGHFQNDLCAACWFNYLLYFMKNVVFAGDPDSGFYAGIVLLSGQIADGIATPLVGIYSDKTNTRIGKRTPWYIFGFVLVTICFVFIFRENNSTDKGARIAYYVFFPSAFNVGWASVQVAHMSLVPSLTLSRKTRDKLNNFRNTFTYIANLYVLLLAFILFLTLNCDYTQFTILSLASVGLGFLTSIFFLVTVREKKITEGCRQIKKEFKKQHRISMDSNASSLPQDKLEKMQKLAGDISTTKMDVSMEDAVSPVSPNDGVEKWELSEDEDTGQVHVSTKKKSVISSMAEEAVSWKHWFKLPAFYIYGFVYMACRLLVNLQSSLIIFYLQNVLGIASGVDTYSNGLPIQFAIIPMIVYLSSTITSSFLKIIYAKIGRKKTFTLGAVSAIAGVIIMMFLGSDSQYFMYPTAVLIGIGQSICLNTGIALIGEVVGVKGASGAFVFGVYSLLDKFANGIILYLVMNLEDVSDPSNSTYIRICACILPGAAIILGWVLIMIGKAADYDAGDVVLDKHEGSKHVN